MIGVRGAPGRERRMTARCKKEAVLRVPDGELLDFEGWERRVTAAVLSAWREAVLAGGAASLKSRPRDDREVGIAQLKAALGLVTMDNELLREKIGRSERSYPLVGRRSKR